MGFKLAHRLFYLTYSHLLRSRVYEGGSRNIDLLDFNRRYSVSLTLPKSKLSLNLLRLSRGNSGNINFQCQHNLTRDPCPETYLLSVKSFSVYKKYNSAASSHQTHRRGMAECGVREVKLPPTSLTDNVSNSNVNDATSSLDYCEFQAAIESCSTCLLSCGVIAVPTDTIYGIAGLSQNIDAVNRIYDIKQRNYEKPVAISVGEIDDIYRWSKVTVPRQLLTDLLPGPVTVVFDRSPELNPSLNPDTSKIGIRIPGNYFMQELAKKCGSPIALTSANISGGCSCLQIEEFQHLWPQLELVVNGGVLNDTQESRLGSTVVDLSAPGYFRIIRNGSAYIPTVKVLQDKYRLKKSPTLSDVDR